MHVGFDLGYLAPDSGGSGTYARELIAALHAVEPSLRITAWVGRDAPGWLADAPMDLVRMPFRATRSPLRPAFSLLGLGLDARRRGVDVVHGLAYAAPVIAPGVATVVTLHDLTWLHHPESVTRLARHMFGLLTPVCGRLCDRVVTASHDACDDLVATIGLDRAKVEVILHGVRPAPASPERREPTILSVGQFAAHKNLVALVEALPAVARRDAVVVLPGRTTPYSEEIAAAARRLGVEGRVRLPGYVSDAELEELFAAASIVVLPSLNEGFGMPLAEAMARGIPVACADAGAMPEVAAGAALLFDPRDPAAIASAIDRLLGDEALREQLIARGRARAGELTWERTARATLQVYERALASRVVGRR